MSDNGERREDIGLQRHLAVESDRSASDLRLEEQAYLRIKRAIIVHDVAPGARVTEAGLAKQTSFSKATVRAALNQLTEDGFVESRSTRTQVVTPITLAHISEVFALRNLLEPDAARRAAGKCDIAKLHELNKACSQGYRYGDVEATWATLMANRSFHMEIARVGAFPRQQRWIEQLHDAAMRILWYTFRVENRGTTWAHGHDEIMAALAAGDGEAAHDIALTHLKNNQALVFELLSKNTAISNIAL